MQPTVSIIVPCFNEQATIGALLDAIREQTYPRDRLEVVIADGLSNDGTRAAVARFQREHPTPAVRVMMFTVIVFTLRLNEQNKIATLLPAY